MKSTYGTFSSSRNCVCIHYHLPATFLARVWGKSTRAVILAPAWASGERKKALWIQVWNLTWKVKNPHRYSQFLAKLLAKFLQHRIRYSQKPTVPTVGLTDSEPLEITSTEDTACLLQAKPRDLKRASNVDVPMVWRKELKKEHTQHNQQPVKSHRFGLKQRSAKTS